MKILVEVSGRHVHLSRKDIDILFGEGYQLKVLKELSQPGQFAAEERVNLIHGDKRMDNVRVLGPERDKTQVELSLTDTIRLKIGAPIKQSGDIEESPGLEIEGPKGAVKLEQGVIISQRHLHASPSEAKELGIKDGELLRVNVEGERGLVFEKIVARVNIDFKLALHLDTDEGNAAGIKGVAEGEIIK